jgi:hypothetical protein
MSTGLSACGVRPDVQAFLMRYAEAGDTKDPEALRACFLDTFLSLDPNTAAAVSLELLIKTLPRREQMFSSAGIIGLDLVECSEIPLDDLHTLVETTWQARLAEPRATSEPLHIPAAFLLRKTDEGWKIAVYLNHMDLSVALQNFD